MEDGRIIESGTHTELMKNMQGHYYDMWMKQLKEEIENANNNSADATTSLSEE
jgi:ABC-type dipeptide/oligopeptide/nickel transport system ATPase component